jgi:hypothetical protein
LTLATATIDKAAKRSTKTTVQLSNIDAGAGGISLTAKLLLGWLAGLLSDWLVRLLSACLSFECLSFECLSFECLSFAVKLMPPAPASILERPPNKTYPKQKMPIQHTNKI